MLDFDEADTVSAPTLDADQKEVLQAVLRPMNSADIAVLLANDGLMRLQLNLRAETGVLIGKEDDKNELLPRSEGDVASLVMAYLAQGGEPLKRAAALNLSQNAFLLLLAAADAYKMNYFDDMLKHDITEVKLTVESLDRAVKDAYEKTDPRWLLPFVFFRSETIPKIDVKAALSELTKAGVFGSGGVILTEEGEAFIDDLMSRKVIADVSSLYVQEAALARSHVMFIRTEHTLWAVRFGEKDDAEILSLTIDDACELMVSLLIQKDEPKDRPTLRKSDAATAEALKCPKCGQKLAPGAKFCARCGTRTPAASAPIGSFCTNCGAKIAPGTHFCVKCGKPCD